MQGIKFTAVDYKKNHIISYGKKLRNKSFISSLVVKVDKRRKTEGFKKTKKSVSKARKTDNPEKKGIMNVPIFL